MFWQVIGKFETSPYRRFLAPEHSHDHPFAKRVFNDSNTAACSNTTIPLFFLRLVVQEASKPIASPSLEILVSLRDLQRGDYASRHSKLLRSKGQSRHGRKSGKACVSQRCTYIHILNNFLRRRSVFGSCNTTSCISMVPAYFISRICPGFIH